MVGGTILGLGNTLASLAAACRENAEKCNAIQMTEQVNVYVPAVVGPLSKLLLAIEEFLWRFAAGLLIGLAVGYLSHLALDAVTPRSIPLLTAGF